MRARKTGSERQYNRPLCAMNFMASCSLSARDMGISDGRFRIVKHKPVFEMQDRNRR